MDEAFRWINQGVAVAMLAFFCYGAWVGLSWLGVNVIKPYFMKQVEFLEKLEDTLSEVKETVVAIREELRSGRK